MEAGKPDAIAASTPATPPATPNSHACPINIASRFDAIEINRLAEEVAEQLADIQALAAGVYPLIEGRCGTAPDRLVNLIVAMAGKQGAISNIASAANRINNRLGALSHE